MLSQLSAINVRKLHSLHFAIPPMNNIDDPFRLRRAPVALLALLALLALGAGCPRRTTQPGPRRVTIGIQVSPAMALVMVAKDKGFFRDAGVDVELREFTAGKFALQAFLGGSLDFAVSGDVPVALAVLQGNDNLRIVSQVVARTTNEVRVVARRDGDVSSPQAFFAARRRRLATSFGGGPEFYTYNFLRRYQVATSSVEIVSQRPEDMPAALAVGSVDAIAIFDPFAYIAETRVGPQAVTFTDPALYSELYVLAAHPDQLSREPQVTAAVLRGLQRAAEFVRAEPAEAKGIVQRYTRLDRAVIEGIWANFDFRPALTPQLLDFWREEAQWARATGKVGASTSTPDFRRLVDDHLLRQLDASAVTLP